MDRCKRLELKTQTKICFVGTSQSAFYGATENPQFLTPRPKSPGKFSKITKREMIKWW